jgi:hypothetical protein
VAVDLLRVDGRRDALLAGAVPDEDDAEARADVFRAAGLRVVLLAVVAARRVVVAARRLVVAVRVALLLLPAAFRASCCTCLLRPSRRFKAFSTSACFAVRRICVWSWSIAVLSVFWPSLTDRSSWRRTSLGTRLSASRRAFLPTWTARPTRLDRLDREDARFLVAMPLPP